MNSRPFYYRLYKFPNCCQNCNWRENNICKYNNDMIPIERDYICGLWEISIEAEAWRTLTQSLVD